MNTRERFGINSLGALLFIGGVIAALVLGALAIGELWTIVGALAVIGIIIVLALTAFSLIVRFAAPAVVGIGQIRLDAQRERNRHEEKFIEHGILPDYRPIPQLPAPPPERETKESPLDPRHELLVNLCLLTIKSDRYGPTSKKLMTADDAQADRSGQFSDRMNWDAASKYGQSVLGLLYARVGGKPEEQGLRIKGDNGSDGTAADLLVALHSRARTDAAVSALPGVYR